MSLFDKLRDTKLKSLKYGNSFGGGNYLEPILTTPIKDSNPIGIQYPFSEFAKENGYRVSHILDNLPRGKQFIRNQNRLNFHNAKLEGYKGLGRPDYRYNPDNTKLQAGNDNVGYHLPRNFGDGSYKYETLVNENNQSGFNRLEKLYNKFEVGSQKQQNNYKFLNNFYVSSLNFANNILNPALSIYNNSASLLSSFTDTNNSNRARKGLPPRPGLNRFNDWYQKGKFNLNQVVSDLYSVTSYFPKGDSQIDFYFNGPSGVGQTVIPRVTYTNDLRKRDQILELVKNNITQRRNFLTQEKLPITRLFTDLGDGSANLGLALANQPEIKNFPEGYSPNATIVDNNLVTTTKKRREFNGNSYTYKSSSPLSVKGSSNPSSITWLRNSKVRAYDDDGIDGRMPVVFNIIDPFTGEVEAESLSFSAYISNFNDSYNPNWNPTSYIGRAEDFYVYNKFSRDLSFNFTIPSFNQNDLATNHSKLARLLSSSMGKYDNNKLGGIIHKLTVGNYLVDQAGILNNISYRIDDNSPWDIDSELAHNINVTVNFKVIHNFLPTYGNRDLLFNITPAEEIPGFNTEGIGAILNLKSGNPQDILGTLKNNALTYGKKTFSPVLDSLGPASPFVKGFINQKLNKWGLFK